MPRPARVLRVAPVPLRPDRLSDLERIFATSVSVSEMATTDPAVLSEAAKSLAVDAIVLDVVRPAPLRRLVDALGAHQLLRPTWAETRTSRGELQPRFAGYGLIEGDGTLRPVADGELAPGE